MSAVTVRYVVDDVEGVIDFCTDLVGFEMQMHLVPGFAGLKRGDLLLVLNEPGAGGAGQAMPDGTLPEPGGWNRFRIEVEDIVVTVERVSERGANFRNEIVAGKGGKQILLGDPAGNAVEPFEHPDV